MPKKKKTIQERPPVQNVVKLLEEAALASSAKVAALPRAAAKQSWRFTTDDEFWTVTVLGDVVVEPVSKNAEKFVGFDFHKVLASIMATRAGVLATRVDGWAAKQTNN